MCCSSVSSDTHSVVDSKSSAVQHSLLEHAQSGCSSQPGHTAPRSSPVPGKYNKASYEPFYTFAFIYLSKPSLSFFLLCSSFRQYSHLSSRSLFTVWMGPTLLVPFHQTLRRHRTSPPRSIWTQTAKSPQFTATFFHSSSPWCFKVHCHRIHTTIGYVE